MDPKNVHLMKLQRKYPSGAEEWYCAECGRRIILQWQPEYSRIILEMGADSVFHTACRVDKQIGPENGRTTEAAGASPQTEEILIDRLSPWREWIKAHFG